MLQIGFLSTLPKEIKILIVLFLVTLSIGFYLGITFVNHTTENKPTGIIENYNGNENDETAETMKFKKSEHEMYNILHTHFLSLSVIFFIIGFLSYGTSIHSKIRKFLMIEPLVSVLLTFGGIYFIWLGFEWMSYLVMFSGILMTVSYTSAVLLILKELLINKKAIV